MVTIEVQNSHGSGFFFKDADGIWIASNTHVVGPAYRSSQLKIYDSSGRSVPVTDSIKVDLAGDLVLVKVAGDFVPTKVITEGSDPNAGDLVAALGNAAGAGIISTLNGEVKGKGATRGVPIVEISCQIVPGCSGGPVVDQKGQLIGVSTYLIPPSKDAEHLYKDTPFADKRQIAVRPRFASMQKASLTDLYLCHRASEDRMRAFVVFEYALHPKDEEQSGRIKAAIDEGIAEGNKPLLERPLRGYRPSGMLEEYYSALSLMQKGYNHNASAYELKEILHDLQKRFPCTAIEEPVHDAIDDALKEQLDYLQKPRTDPIPPSIDKPYQLRKQ